MKQSKYFRLDTLLLLIVSLLFCSSYLYAISPAEADDHTQNARVSSLSVSLDVIKRKLDAVKADTGISKENQASLESLYNKSISNLESSVSHEQSAQEFIKAENEAQTITKKLLEETAQKEKISPEKTLELSAGDKLEKLEPLLLKEEANLASVVAKLTRAKERLKFHTERPQIIRQRLIEANREADGIANELQKPVPEGEPPALSEARRWSKETGATMLSAEIKMLDQELLSHPMRIELLKAELAKAEHSERFMKDRVKYLNDIVNEKRQAKATEVQVEAEFAERQAEGQHHLVQKLAESNSTLSTYISEITANLKQIEEEDKNVSEQAKRIDQDYKSAKQKLEIAGMSKILGKVLQEQRRALPDTRLYRKKTKYLENQIADVSLQQIEYKEEQVKLSNIDHYVQNYISSVEAEEHQQLENTIRELASSRTDYLEQVVSIQDAYIRALNELDFSQIRMLDAALIYDDFLAERLLWVRSAPAVNFTNFSAIPLQLQNLLSPRNWFGVVDTLLQKENDRIYLLLALIVVTILLWKRRAMRLAMHATGKFIGKPTKDSILFTFQGILWTLLLALAWPLLMVSIGMHLQDAITATVFTKAVAEALVLIAEGVFILLAFSILCEKHGVAARHFRWPEISLPLLRRDINILIYAFLPLGFISIVIINSDFSEQGVGLGRLTFILMMIALTLFFYRVLNPTRGALQAFFIDHKKPTMVGIRYSWLVLGVLLPITAAILAMAGYIYSAGTLVRSLVQTLWLLMILFTLHQFVVRWLLVVRGRLLLQAVREKREAARLAVQEQHDGTITTDEAVQDHEEPEVDIAALGDDSMRLLNVTMVILGGLGIWRIWSDILPAFGIFDQFTLYQHKVDVAGEITYRAITIGDIGQVILTAVILVMLIRRLPAFLEILLRQKASISTGSVYAIKSLTNYALIGIGIVIIFSQLGGAWSEIQWVFAALGVGIGFGLQEIVANFISGLIILFERPIRVGDVVTVGDVSGTVTKIRIRATTIRDWDKKELLVPNKEFITSRLLNWSLSDSVTRLIISVGVAYGSDVQLAMKLMEEAARESDMVMDDPSPYVTFEGFGDNTLDLRLRVHIDNLDYRIPVISEMHSAINEKFNNAGIVIAFPQRDVHLDTTKPLDIRLKRDK